MSSFKFLKTVIISMIIITIFSTNPVFAAPDLNQSTAIQNQELQVNNRLLEKQREIDQYVFEQHKDEIKTRGFKVTHTGPIDNYVEIGITPYNEENAEYLYEIFGRELVKVVEGQQAVTLGTESNSNSSELATANTVKLETKEKSGIILPIIIALLIGSVVVLSRTKMVNRRKK